VLLGHAAGPLGTAVGAGAADALVLAALTAALTQVLMEAESSLSRITTDIDVNVN
jgi:hypothetical protein